MRQNDLKPLLYLIRKYTYAVHCMEIFHSLLILPVLNKFNVTSSHMFVRVPFNRVTCSIHMPLLSLRCNQT